MSNRDQTGLAMYVERARKVLQHEQRLHHQDQAIKPGGLEAFVTRWAEEICAICQSAVMDVMPIYHFVEYLKAIASKILSSGQQIYERRSLFSMIWLGKRAAPGPRHRSQRRPAFRARKSQAR